MPDGSYAIDLANYDFENSAAVGFFFDAVSMSNALRAGAMEITQISPGSETFRKASKAGPRTLRRRAANNLPFADGAEFGQRYLRRRRCLRQQPTIYMKMISASFTESVGFRLGRTLES